jgi:hypothetical protein
MRSRRMDALVRSATAEDPYSSFPLRNFVIVAPPCAYVHHARNSHNQMKGITCELDGHGESIVIP